ncbi:MAG: methionyl-tRNA formyltransferase, partial [Chloroflexota bacterium]
APRISKSDGLIDWTQPADKIDRQCRAYHPWPGAFTYWNDQRLKVLRAYPLPMNAVDVEPGTVVRTQKGIAVISGQGAIILETIQLAGKRAISGIEFARGQRSFVGSSLGTSQADTHGTTSS